jgi:hypothetical protein
MKTKNCSIKIKKYSKWLLLIGLISYICAILYHINNTFTKLDNIEEHIMNNHYIINNNQKIINDLEKKK